MAKSENELETLYAAMSDEEFQRHMTAILNESGRRDEAIINKWIAESPTDEQLAELLQGDADIPNNVRNKHQQTSSWQNYCKPMMPIRSTPPDASYRLYED